MGAAVDIVVAAALAVWVVVAAEGLESVHFDIAVPEAALIEVAAAEPIHSHSGTVMKTHMSDSEVAHEVEVAAVVHLY